MKVVLPDASELELADGATGLDAAAAIGPKLAEDAILVRSNGKVQDVRLPLEDGQQVQILTSRDRDDPDADLGPLVAHAHDGALAELALDLGQRALEGGIAGLDGLLVFGGGHGRRTFLSG